MVVNKTIVISKADLETNNIRISLIIKNINSQIKPLKRY